MDLTSHSHNPPAENDPSELAEDISYALAPELTLGLMHQVNNILTGVFFHMEEALDQVPADHPAQATLSELSKAIHSFHKIIDRTSEVNLPPPAIDSSYHTLDGLVEQQSDLLRLLLSKSVRLEIRRTEPSPAVRLRDADFRVLLLLMALHMRQKVVGQHGFLVLASSGTDGTAILDFAISTANQSRASARPHTARITQQLTGQALEKARRLCELWGLSLEELPASGEFSGGLRLKMPSVNLSHT